jgi:hypothetical protein
VAFELIFELESVARSAIELDAALPCNGQCLFIGRERVIRNWVVEELMNLGRCHLGNLYVIGVALYYHSMLVV